MKNIFIFCICFFCAENLFSQKYSFDYLLIETMVNKKNNYNVKSYSFVSSANPWIQTRITEGYKNQKLILEIYDFRTLSIHHFSIKSTDDPLISSNYKYFGTGKIVDNRSYDSEMSKKVFDQKFVENLIIGKRAIYSFFENQKKKKLEFEFYADLVENKDDLRIFSISFMRSIPPKFIQLNNNENYYIKHAEWSKDDNHILYDNEIQSVSLELIVSETEKIFEFKQE